MGDTQFHSLVERARSGDTLALNELLIEMQVELRKTVERTRRRRRGLSMQTTEIFNEAFLKLFKKSVPGFNDREHLLAMWANATSWVVIEAWRRKGRRPELDELVEESVAPVLLSAAADPVRVQALFDELKKSLPHEGLAAELSLLSGLPVGDIATLLDRSKPTIHRWVRVATSWIQIRLGEDTPATDATCA